MTVAVLALAIWGLATFGSTTAIESGRRLYPYRRVLAELDAASARHPSAVVWLGDSTIETHPELGIVAYPDLIRQSELAPRHLTSTLVQGGGFDPYTFHSLVQRALALHPKVIVLIANPRLFTIGGATTRSFDDLTAAAPLPPLRDFLTLPYNFRGMSLPRLLLTRALRYESVLQGFYWFQGIRDEIQHAEAWKLLGPEQPAGAADQMRTWVAGWKLTVESYDAPITRSNPLVRFLAATVREITAAGVPSLVIVTPIPVAKLTEAGRYDPRRYAGRIDALREAVEGGGGTLLDLHDAAGDDDFRDFAGHFSAAGMESMRSLVWPALSRLLGEVPDPAGRPNDES